MLLSVVIPARDEQDCIESTVRELAAELAAANVPHEILVVDDASVDDTAATVNRLTSSIPSLRLLRNPGPHGFGCAVTFGIRSSRGDAAAVFMADLSDSPKDLVLYYRKLQEGYECVFGSRFIKGSHLIDYPAHKLILNRFANRFIAIIFGIRYNDVTNAFKCYRREVIEGIEPLLSKHYNLTVEMPLKAIIRGYSYTVVPISWRNRQTGVSKLRLKEMGSRYLFIVLYLWLEKHLSRGDYHRSGLQAPTREGRSQRA
ncbi:MAG: glycosyltransferase family 2 protein [Acidimicrobiia bacterium]|nr:glycosyltransferase family 2 protein [Acidimicrobiia bacterium]